MTDQQIIHELEGYKTIVVQGEYIASDRHTIGLFSSRVVVVQLATQEVKPLLEVQDSVIREVTWTTLDNENTLVRQVLGQASGDHTTSSTTANDDVVVAVDILDRELVGSGHVEGGEIWREMKR